MAVIGSLFAIVNPFAGMMVAAAALVWSLTTLRAGTLVDSYRVATWIAVVALLINVVVLLLSLASGVGGATTPVVVPVDPH